MIRENYVQNLNVTFEELSSSTKEFGFFVSETRKSHVRWRERVWRMNKLRTNDWQSITRRQDIPSLERLHQIATERENYLAERIQSAESVLSKMREYEAEIAEAVRMSKIGSMLDSLVPLSSDHSEDMADKVQALLLKSRQITHTSRAFDEVQQYSLPLDNTQERSSLDF